jgi:hypothetical protein
LLILLPIALQAISKIVSKEFFPFSMKHHQQEKYILSGRNGRLIWCIRVWECFFRFSSLNSPSKKLHFLMEYKYPQKS